MTSGRKPAAIVVGVFSVALGAFVVVGHAVEVRTPFDARVFGRSAGVASTLSCPENWLMVGLQIAAFKRGLVDAGGALCWQDASHHERGESGALQCARGDDMVGIYGAAGRKVTRLGIICQGADAPYLSALVGHNYRGADFASLCPEGQRVRAVELRQGNVINAIGIDCDRR